MVSTSFSLSASTTRWYPSVSSAGASAVAAVSSVEGAVMVRGPPWAVMPVLLLVLLSAARILASKTYRRPADRQHLSIAKRGIPRCPTVRLIDSRYRLVASAYWPPASRPRRLADDSFIRHGARRGWAKAVSAA